MKPTKRPRPESAREYVRKRIKALDEERLRHWKNANHYSAMECVRARNELRAVLRRLPREGWEMSKLFQIKDDDLHELERTLPELADGLMPLMTDGNPAANRVRVQIRRVKEILSNVRWNYGPWSGVEIIPADDADGPPSGGAA